MKKLILCVVWLCLGSIAVAQTTPVGVENNLSPGGVLDNVFDQFGNNYKLADIVTGQTVRDTNGNILRSTSPTAVSAGYFNLYFETGSGMEGSDATSTARRNVLIQVFKDISNFITSPLTTTGNKVNIWVRNFSNLNHSAGVGAVASSFYYAPYKNLTAFGGIIDNEIWKTIHLGKDSYINTVSPLNIDPLFTNSSGVFYHGLIGFDQGYSWNTDLSATSISNYDLYSVALHEITHALGFASLIGSNGSSKLGTGFNYYTRYDLKLKNSANTNTLIGNLGACNSMYNYSFYNTVLTSTNCANSVRYVGSYSVKTYTPNTFNPGSSLSHFHYDSACNTGNFVMNSSIGAGVIRRNYTLIERNVLSEIGYTVCPNYVVNSTAPCSFTSTIAGINVAGINDGISNESFTYNYVIGSAIPLTLNSDTNSTIRILNNDYNATRFECLQDITDFNSVFSYTSGTPSTKVTFTSNVEGLHLLRYVPINDAGPTVQRGNITYIYVMVESNNSCGTASPCDLIKNGNFEQHTSVLSVQGTNHIAEACGWSNGNNESPDYHNSDYTAAGVTTKVPCNYAGYQEDKIVNNKGYGGVAVRKNPSSISSETIKTLLTAPLQPYTSYQLSFDLSLGEGSSANSVKFQAYLSNSHITYNNQGEIPISNPNMLFTNPTYSRNYNGWQKIIFNFTTDANANQKSLYLGGLSQFEITSNSPASQNIGGCNYLNANANTPGNTSLEGYSYYYIDNVSLIPLNGGSFTVTPSSICNSTTTLSDLSLFLSGLPANGVFSGTGVSYNSTTGKYSFSSAAAANGQNTITYTYTNANGCSVSLYCNVVVLKSNPVITGNSSACLDTTALATQTYSTTIPSGVNATWTATGGTIQGSNNGGVVTVLWNSLPGQLTLTFTSGGCTKTVTKAVYPNCCQDCIDSLYMVAISVPNSGGKYRYYVKPDNPNPYCEGFNLVYQWKDLNTIINTTNNYTPNIYYLNETVISKVFVNNLQGVLQCQVCFGCGSSSKITDTEEFHLINLYPNPSDGMITISEKNANSIEVFDIFGKKIFFKENLDTNSLDLTNLNDGVYFVKINSNNKIVTEKIIIKK